MPTRLERLGERYRKRFLDGMCRQLNGLFDGVVGGQQRAKFFDVDAIDPRLHQLDENHDAIRSELLGLLDQQDRLPQYHDLDPVQQRISGTTPGKWNVFVLYAMGRTLSSARRCCPRTTAILDAIPNKFEAFFSILEPRKSVPAHNGPYLGYLRYHLGVKVPAEAPPTIRVGDRRYTWQEGQSMMFDDSWDHEVFNESDEARAILVVDVFRPMPWWPDLLNRTASRFGFATAYGKHVAARQERIFGG